MPLLNRIMDTLMKNLLSQGARTHLKPTFILHPLTLRVAAALGLCMAVPLQVNAADKPTVMQLEPMVITGVAQQSPIKVVTDPRIPRQPVPASDAADYLKTIPGFSAVRSGGVNSDPVFRGMFGSRIKLLTILLINRTL